MARSFARTWTILPKMISNNDLQLKQAISHLRFWRLVGFLSVEMAHVDRRLYIVYDLRPTARRLAHVRLAQEDTP